MEDATTHTHYTGKHEKDESGENTFACSCGSQPGFCDCPV